MNKHLKYLRYVILHKYYVFWACLRLGVPLWSAIWHDWDKFFPDEWFPYAMSFYGPQPRTQETKDYFNLAWNLHQKRNRHHWQFWCVLLDDGGIVAMRMPDKDRREMLADWIGAGLAQGKPDTAAWYLKKGSAMQLHVETRIWIEQQLGVKVMVAV